MVCIESNHTFTGNWFTEKHLYISLSMRTEEVRVMSLGVTTFNYNSSPILVLKQLFTIFREREWSEMNHKKFQTAVEYLS